MTFFESLYYKIVGLPSQADLGPVVRFGNKKYYAAQLEDLVIQNTLGGTVVFSTVNPNNESQNVSSYIAKKGQMLGKVVDVITGETTYLAIKNEKGTFFVDPLYLNDADILNVPTSAEMDKKRAQAEKEGSKPLFSIPTTVWVFIGIIVAIVIIPKRFWK